MYKFIKTKDPNNEFEHDDITFEIPDNVTVYKLIDSFHRFLKACSFQFNINDQIVLKKDCGETSTDPIDYCGSCIYHNNPDLLILPCFYCSNGSKYHPKPKEHKPIVNEPGMCCKECVNYLLTLYKEPCYSCYNYSSFTPKSKE